MQSSLTENRNFGCQLTLTLARPLRLHTYHRHNGNKARSGVRVTRQTYFRRKRWVSMAKKNRMTIDRRDDFQVLDLGNMEIWDGADLALLRETLTRLIETEGNRAVGVDLTYVKYIPSGFFGMLYDWHEKGVAIQLYAPQPHVKNMLWFRQFFAPLVGDGYLLHSEPKQELGPDTPQRWVDERDWKTKTPTSHSVATATSK